MITEFVDMLTGTKLLDRIGRWFYSLISYKRLALNSVSISDPIMEKIVISEYSKILHNVDFSSHPKLYAILLVYQGKGINWELLGLNEYYRLLFKGEANIDSSLFSKDKSYIYLKGQ